MNEQKPKVIILVAGEGKRLRPYTDDRPKCLVEVGGISLLDRQLNILRKRGIGPVILVGGYKYEMLMAKGDKFYLNDKYANTNMLWTLFCAEAELEDEIIISYGDIVYSSNVLDALLDSKSDISIIVDVGWESYWRQRSDDPLNDAETLRLDRESRIIEIGQKPDSLADIEGQYIGLMKFSSAGLKVLKKSFYEASLAGKIGEKNLENAFMTDMLQHMIESGAQLEAIKINGEWVEVDTVQDLKNGATKQRLEKIDLINRN